jgi:hypothetical protein
MNVFARYLLAIASLLAMIIVVLFVIGIVSGGGS